jgi:hypothetical protein
VKSDIAYLVAEIFPFRTGLPRFPDETDKKYANTIDFTQPYQMSNGYPVYASACGKPVDPFLINSRVSVVLEARLSQAEIVKAWTSVTTVITTNLGAIKNLQSTTSFVEQQQQRKRRSLFHSAGFRADSVRSLHQLNALNAGQMELWTASQMMQLNSAFDTAVLATTVRYSQEEILELNLLQPIPPIEEDTKLERRV